MLSVCYKAEHVAMGSAAVAAPWMSPLGSPGMIDHFSLVLSAPKG